MELPTITRDIIAQQPQLFEGVQSKEERLARISRELHNAGYYLTASGWKKISPDVRDKISIRLAIKQPDGKYLIDDVDVFYPNKLKPGDEHNYTVERCLLAISNSNKAIAAGAQAPPLSVGHIQDADILLNDLGCGRGINWRQSPKGEGWLRCTLVDIDPQVYEDWRYGKYTGLSLGFAGKANDKDLRVHHIALLGNKVQMLAELPRVDIFEAVCFTNVPLKEFPMLDQRKAGLIKTALTAVTDALSQVEAGNKDSAARVAEAQALFSATLESEGIKFDDVFSAMGNPASDEGGIINNKDGGTPNAPEGVPPAEDDGGAGKELNFDPSELDGGGVDNGPGGDDDDELFIDDEEDDDLGTAFTDQEAAAAIPAGAIPRAGTGPGVTMGPPDTFAAVLQKQNLYIQKLSKKVEKLLQDQQKKPVYDTKRDEFSAFCNTMETLGHKFNKQATLSLFEAVKGNDEAIKTLMNSVKSSPILTGKTVGGATFGAEGSASILPQNSPYQQHADEVAGVLNDMISKSGVPSQPLSDKDLNIAIGHMSRVNPRR